MTEWIDVNKRLPLHYENIGFTYHLDGKIRKDVFFSWYTKQFEERKIGDWTGKTNSPVTHWTLFPKPPELNGD